MNTHTSVTILLLVAISLACARQEPLQTPDAPGGETSRLPYLTSDSSGTVYLSWVEPAAEDGRHRLLYSTLDRGQWSPPKEIASSSKWFVNWADYPSIVASGGAPRAAHSLRKIPGNTYSYNVNIFLNSNGRWSPPLTPHHDSTATEHGFASMVPWKGKVLAVWLDGRQTHDRSDEEYFDIEKAMTLRSAVITPDGEVTHKRLIDDSVCDCCNTSLARTARGAVAAYRNRTGEEIRDIYVSRYDGKQWTPPVAVHDDGWNIAACPVNGPAVAAADSMVAVAWYTGADKTPTVKAARSNDFGAHFNEPVTINEAEPLGRVDAGVDRKGNTYVSWIEQAADGHRLKVRRIGPDGTLSRAYAVAEMNSSRKSGFPQMELSGDRLVFAWTHVDSSQTRIRTAVLSPAVFQHDD